MQSYTTLTNMTPTSSTSNTTAAMTAYINGQRPTASMNIYNSSSGAASSKRLRFSNSSGAQDNLHPHHHQHQQQQQQNTYSHHPINSNSKCMFILIF